MKPFDWTRRFMGAAALLSGLYLVACGGGDDGGTRPVATTTVLAGSLQGAGSADGVGLAAQFTSLYGMVQDGAGNTYVADGSALRKMAPDGTVSTLAGSLGQTGNTDGVGAAARFNVLRGLAVDTAGNVYAADFGNSVIRKVSPAGVVSTYAGVPHGGRTGTRGYADGPGASALFSLPTGLALDQQGNLYVADSGNGVVRKITPDRMVSTFAGMAGQGAASVAGDGSAARFFNLTGVAVGADGSVFASEGSLWGDFQGEESSLKVRKFNHLAQAVPWGASADGIVRGAGNPQSLIVDGQGNVFVASGGSLYVESTQTLKWFSAVKKIAPDGVVQTVAGDDVLGVTDGPATTARFNQPQGIALDAQGRLIVADTGNFSIRQIDTNGVVTTLAGGCGRAGFASVSERCGMGYVDGQGGQARFFSPKSITATPDGSLYVADGANKAVRKVGLDGRVSTVTAADGTPHQFNDVFYVHADPSGNIWLAESPLASGLPDTVSMIDTKGVKTAVAFNHCMPLFAIDERANCYFRWDGPEIKVGSINRVGQIWSKGFDCQSGCSYASAPGVLYVADTYDHTLTALANDGRVKWVAGKSGHFAKTDGPASTARFERPLHLTVDAAGEVYLVDGASVRQVSADGTVRTVADLTGNLGAPGIAPGTLTWMRGLAWSKGALYALVQNAVVKITLPAN